VTTPGARLVSRTRARLAIVLLLLMILLVAGIGIATAYTGLTALDSSVDRSLRTTADATMTRLEGNLPARAGATTGATGGDGEGDSGDTSTEDVRPASADTFEMFLKPDGTISSNPSRIALAGLPDAAAANAARTSGRDFRSVTAGGVAIRLLTEPIRPHDGGTAATPVGFLQVGFVLTLHDEQSTDLIRAIVIVALAGLAGAALITLFVTGRALVPIRAAFDHERRFVADASHEIRTPTALIRANAEVMQREGFVQPAGHPFVEDIIAESDRLARLVADLLTLTSTGSRSLVIERHPGDLGEIAEDTVRRTVPLAEERGVALSYAGPANGGGVPIAGDRDRLIQLLLILLDNAIRHSPEGGAVRVEAWRDGPTAIVAVADQGPGVPAASRERIFEPFARLNTSRARREEGSGLGLAIGRTIAERHGGSIRVDDAPGGGALFIVSIPSA
jgi:two-component system sensor histidine kinase CiaH